MMLCVETMRTELLKLDGVDTDYVFINNINVEENAKCLDPPTRALRRRRRLGTSKLEISEGKKGKHVGGGRFEGWTVSGHSGWGSHGDEGKNSQGSGEISGGGEPPDPAEVRGGAPLHTPPQYNYDPECARVEAWLDDHQDFVYDYFIRKASRHMVDSWLLSHALPQSLGVGAGAYCGAGPGEVGPGTGLGNSGHQNSKASSGRERKYKVNRKTSKN